VKAAFYTLGCKVNQYESQVLGQQFFAAGYEVVPWSAPAHIYVINSCTVTAQSEKKAAQLVRRLRREHPQALIALCGCWPQAFPEKVKELEVDVIAGTARLRLVELVKRALETGQRVVEIIPHSPKETFEPMRATAMEGHTRAFVKIEDGCDRFCSYCIIPYARGRVRSKPLEELREEAELLAEQGFQEIVLTGINLSSYGKGEAFGLLEGVKTVADVPGVQRVRLGSLEPDLTDDELIKGLARVKEFCPQFHLSVQSGCNATLKRMNRRYTAEEYLQLCQKLNQTFDMPAVTTDLMVGFAGETEEEFEQTLDFLQQANFAKVHVFPYSRRPGTAADRMEGQVTEEEKARRAARAAQAAEQSRRSFLEQMVGRLEPVLFERCNLPGIGRGHAPNGTQVQVCCDQPLRGRLLTVRLEDITPDGEYCAGTVLDLQSNGNPRKR